MKGVTNTVPPRWQLVSFRLKWSDHSLPAGKTAFVSMCASWKVMGYCHNPVSTLVVASLKTLELGNQSGPICTHCCQLCTDVPDWGCNRSSPYPRVRAAQRCWVIPSSVVVGRLMEPFCPWSRRGLSIVGTVVVPMWEFSLPPDLNETTKEEKREIPVESKRMWRLLHTECWYKCFGLIRGCLSLGSLPWPENAKGRWSDGALLGSSHEEGARKPIKYKCKFRKCFWGKYRHIDFGLVLAFNHLAADGSHAFANMWQNLAGSKPNLQGQRPYFFTLTVILVQSAVS